MRSPQSVLAALVLVAGGGVTLAESPGKLSPTPPAFTTPLLTAEQVGRSVESLDNIVGTAMERTGVPGIAVAVVYRDQVLYSRGYGVREVGYQAPIDTDTVFQLASISKPIASTVVAALVGRGLADWSDPVRDHLPFFVLSDPFVTAKVTIADLLSHRSGIYTASGDLLEDLGYDRAYIMAHLRMQPLDSFRSSYNYSNFGFTLGAEAAAAAAGTAWEDLARSQLFAPLGMTRSSYRHADYAAHKNRARLHVRQEATGSPVWVAQHDRQPDAQAPAGGASGSIRDLTQFMRLQLAGGRFENVEVVDHVALAFTHTPQVVPSLPRTPLSRAGFYGLGWNVTYDDRGRLEISHAGAFYLGASTYLIMIPGEQLGIAVLTNGMPIGVPEGIARTFLDTVENGHPTVDWFTLFEQVFAGMWAADAAGFSYGERPADVQQPQALSGYTGIYANAYYGPADISVKDGMLEMTMGPHGARKTMTLAPHDGDTFSFQPVGENAVTRAGVAFQRDPTGQIAKMIIDYYDRNGLGTFVRDPG